MGDRVYIHLAFRVVRNGEQKKKSERKNNFYTVDGRHLHWLCGYEREKGGGKSGTCSIANCFLIDNGPAGLVCVRVCFAQPYGTAVRESFFLLPTG